MPNRGFVISLCALFFGSTLCAQTQMAGMHPGPLWQQASATTQNPDGAVLYQVIFNSDAMPKPQKGQPQANPGTGRVLNTVGATGAPTSPGAPSAGVWLLGGNAGTG